MKHWKYISEHTVSYWAASNIAELQRATVKSGNVRCYGLGFGLNFRVVTLDPNFRRLDNAVCAIDYARAKNRVILLDYDGTLVPSTTYDQPPSPELLNTFVRSRMTSTTRWCASCLVVNVPLSTIGSRPPCLR